MIIKCEHEQQIRGSIVVSISARHAEDPGSIPGRGILVLIGDARWCVCVCSPPLLPHLPSPPVTQCPPSPPACVQATTPPSEETLLWSHHGGTCQNTLGPRHRSQVRGSIVVSISACHAEDPGSIPGRGISTRPLWTSIGAPPPDRTKACGHARSQVDCFHSSAG